MVICDYSDSGILQPTDNSSLLEPIVRNYIQSSSIQHLATPFPDSALGVLDSRPGGICGSFINSCRTCPKQYCIILQPPYIRLISGRSKSGYLRLPKLFSDFNLSRRIRLYILTVSRLFRITWTLSAKLWVLEWHRYHKYGKSLGNVVGRRSKSRWTFGKITQCVPANVSIGGMPSSAWRSKA